MREGEKGRKGGSVRESNGIKSEGEGGGRGGEGGVRVRQGYWTGLLWSPSPGNSGGGGGVGERGEEEWGREGREKKGGEGV